MANSFQSYVLALLTLVRNQEDVNDNPALGIAIRHDADTSSFNMPAHNLLGLLIEHSPSPETIARLFIAELASCEIPAVKDLVNTLNSSGRSVTPGDRAMAVQQKYDKPGAVESRTAYRRQAALQEPIVRRDGPRCLITGASFVGDGSVIPHCTHIIPFSIHHKPILHYAIEMFTGHQLSTENIRHLINHPSNIINIESNAYDSMHRKLAWGIEAIRSVNNEWKYYFRALKGVPCLVTLKDGDKIQLGRGSGGSTIALPDPRAFNLHLTICRVFAASGAAEVVDKYLEDLGDDQPVSQSTTRPHAADAISVDNLFQTRCSCVD